MGSALCRVLVVRLFLSVCHIHVCYVECAVSKLWLVVFYVPDVFAASDCEFSTSLSYVCLVASFACNFVGTASV
jgi:hypothetical protein